MDDIFLEEIADDLFGEEVNCSIEGSPLFLRKVTIALQLLEPFAEDTSTDAVPCLGTISQVSHKLRRARRAFRLLQDAIQYDLEIVLPDEDQQRISGTTYHLYD